MNDSASSSDEQPTTSRTRRAVLGASGTAALTALAGCDHNSPVNPSPNAPKPDLTLKDVRVVQTVEDCSLTTGSASLSDPPIVAGQNVSVLFDVSITNPGNLPETVEMLVSSTPDASETPAVANLHRDDLRAINNGADAAAVFHERARMSGFADAPPVFEIPEKVSSLKVELIDAGVKGDQVTLNEGSNADFELATLSKPLRVGFMPVKDPGSTGSPRVSQQEANNSNCKVATTDIDWGDANGEAKNYDRSVRSSFEYLKRAYPGEVVAYKHPKSDPLVGVIAENYDPKGADNDACRDTYDWGAGVDAWRMEDAFTKIRKRSNFPRSDATIMTSGNISRQRAVNLMDADKGGNFDSEVMICPKGTATGNRQYFAAHNMSAGGYHWGENWAVASLEAEVATTGPSDLGHATTTAQEIGHDLGLGIYSGSFKLNPSDSNHANNNLKAAGYDLTQGIFTLITNPDVRDGSFSVSGPATPGGTPTRTKYPSYMSYAAGDKWVDSKIHSVLINQDMDRNPSLAAGAAAGNGLPTDGADGEVQPVLRLFGFSEGGDVDVDLLTVRDDVQTDTAETDWQTGAPDTANPVELAALEPGGEHLVRTAVPDRVQGTHGDQLHEYVAATMPFPDLTVELEVQTAEGSMRLNAITRPMRDAIGRVPEEGLTGAETRARLRTNIDEVEAAMAEGQYAAAADVLQEDVRPLLADSVVRYEGSADKPTREDLLRLVDRLAERLRLIAEETQ